MPSAFVRGFFLLGLCLVVLCAWNADEAMAGSVSLQSLIDETLKKSPEILSSRSRADAARYRVPQAGSLPDPMFMFGYQNEGWKKYTYGEMEGAQWMFSASQMFPYPGKLGIKEDMASRDREGVEAAYRLRRLQTVARVRELYFDLLVTYKGIDLIQEKTSLYSKVEDAALARYSAGMGNQSDVLMAQTEKYMLREKEEMLRQKVQATEAMLNAVIGREITAEIGRPEETSAGVMPVTLEALISRAYEHSPELRAKESMVAAAEARVRLAEKEYYPDFTVNAGYFRRAGEFEDMWSLTTSINIPLYYKKKQRQGVLEARAMLAEARQELQAARLMVASAIRDNYSMYRTASGLIDLYRGGLIPKTHQDVDSALAAYSSGKSEIMTVITRLKSLIDIEMLAWTQFGEREKAAARIGTLIASEEGLETKDRGYEANVRDQEAKGPGRESDHGVGAGGQEAREQK